MDREADTRTARRRRRRFRRAGVVLVAAAASAGAALGVLAVRDDLSTSRRPAAGTAAAEQTTTLIAMTLAGEPTGRADSLTLVAHGRGRPVVLFIPTGTLGLIPGGGFDPIGRAPIGKALTLGQLSLQQLTIENMLGIAIDASVGLDDVTLAQVVDRIGGVEIDVTETLLEADDQGRRTPVFSLGSQRMKGAAALTYMTYRGEGESELDRFVRAQKVWDAILRTGGADRLVAIIRDLGPGIGGVDGAGALAVAVRALAASPARTYEVMPAEPAGSGPDEVYRADDARLSALVDRLFGSSRPPESVVRGARLEILNGNGEPEAGRRVAAVLVPAGMKVIVTGNAKRFTFPETRIVVYGRDDRALEMGRKVRDLLGVGTVEIGRRSQTVVDVTVVMGRDLLSS